MTQIHNHNGPKVFDRQVWAQIRLLLKERSDLQEQSDQGLHCLPFRLHLVGALLYGKANLFTFYDNYFLGVQMFRNCKVCDFYISN